MQLKIDEVAALLRCCPRTVIRMLDDGRLIGARLGRKFTRLPSYQFHTMFGGDARIRALLDDCDAQKVAARLGDIAQQED